MHEPGWSRSAISEVRELALPAINSHWRTAASWHPNAIATDHSIVDEMEALLVSR